jgi:hypothetical protein
MLRCPPIKYSYLPSACEPNVDIDSPLACPSKVKVHRTHPDRDPHRRTRRGRSLPTPTAPPPRLHMDNSIQESYRGAPVDPGRRSRCDVKVLVESAATEARDQQLHRGYVETLLLCIEEKDCPLRCRVCGSCRSRWKPQA